MTPGQGITIGWDWYGATIETSPDELLARLVRATDTDVEMLTRAGRWSALWNLRRGEDVVCMMAISDERPDEPFVEAKSHAPEIVPMLREWHPAHRVARVDARLDFHDELWWEVIEAELLAFCQRKGTLLEPDGPHTQPHLGGRTWDAGKSKGWQRCVTLYEKGCELRLPTRSPIRLEAKVRPPSKLKAHYATLTEQEVLLDNAFVRHLVERIGLDLGTAVRAKVERNRTDLDRLLDVFARQYLGTFKLLAERYSTMQELRDELQRRAELEQEIREHARNARVTWATRETA